MLNKGSMAVRDMIALSVVVMAALGVAVYFDAFERFERWAQGYEGWQVDELVVVPLVLAVAFSLYSWRRRRELVAEVAKRENIEKTLGESEQRFRLLAENAGDLIYRYRLKPTPGFEYVSPAATTITGYTPEEHYADPDLGRKIVHPDDAYLIEEAPRRPGALFTIRWRHKHGRVVWTEQRNKPVYDEAGELVAIEGIARDVTERKEGEEALRRSEERFRSLVQNASDVILIMEAGGAVRYISPAVERMLGYKPEDVVGNDNFDVVHPDDLALVGDFVAEAVKNPGVTTSSMQLRLRHADGSWRYVESRCTSLLEDPAVGGIVFNSRDVTERKKVEEALRESYGILQAVTKGTTDLIYVKDLHGRYVMVNSAAAGFLERPAREMIGKDDNELFPPEIARGFIEHDRRILAGGETQTYEERVFEANGETRFYITVRGVCRDALGETIGVFGISRDITERKWAEEKLRESEANLAEAQRIAHLGSWEYEPEKHKVYWSDETYRIFGFTPQQFAPTFQNFLDAIHPDDGLLIREDMAKLLRGERPQDGGIEFRIVQADGQVRFVEGQRNTELDEAGGLIKMVGTVQDVTERKALEMRLEHQAFHDGLTGLPNRALFAARLEQALTRSDGREERVAVLFVDIDDFKNVNDSLGHWAGDKLLTEFARRLDASVRPGDTVARFGGDEFTVLLEGVVEERVATAVAERAIKELRREPFVVGAREIYATPSIGIALSGYAERGWEDLLRRADLALHRAKEEGKARHACFTPDLDDLLQARLRLEGELREVLEREEFRVFYQPKVSIASGEIEGMEALVRWEHPQRGLLPPAEFLAVAEETSLVVPMGRWVLREACRQAKEWQQRYPKDPPLAMSVNLSAKQFRRQDLAEEVGAVLRESGLDPCGLTLEITEETAMEDARATAEALRKLKAMGVRIEVDDFGTGYSSLSYLKRFPVDYLKVDRTFVAGLGRNPEDEGIVRAVVELAHTLGLKVVAEGVESGEQLGLLREMGCELAQGSYFWSPLPAEAAGELLAAYNA